MCEPGADPGRGTGKHTLISVRRMPTEPKTILAGAIDETFSARLIASRAAFNSSMAPPRPLGFWGSSFMVETWGGRERTVGCEDCEEGF